VVATFSEVEEEVTSPVDPKLTAGPSGTAATSRTSHSKRRKQTHATSRDRSSSINSSSFSSDSTSSSSFGSSPAVDFYKILLKVFRKLMEQYLQSEKRAKRHSKKK
jgi:hypothetical protein